MCLLCTVIPTRARWDPTRATWHWQVVEAEPDAAETVDPSTRRPLKDHVEAFERLQIEAALRRHHGAIAPAMEELALPRRTLNEKMAKYGISRTDFV